MISRKERFAKRIKILLSIALALFLCFQFYGTTGSVSGFKEFEVGRFAFYIHDVPPSSNIKNALNEPIVKMVKTYKKSLLGRLRHIGTSYIWKADENGENGTPFSHYLYGNKNDLSIIIYYSLAKPREGYSVMYTSPYDNAPLTYPLTATQNGAYAIIPNLYNYNWQPQLIAP